MAAQQQSIKTRFPDGGVGTKKLECFAADMCEMENLVNELLGAVQSSQHPWESNLEALKSIIDDISQAERGHADRKGTHCHVTIHHNYNGENRYHHRVARAQRQKDVEEFKKAMEKTLKDVEAVEDARREYRLNGPTAKPSTVISAAGKALNKGWEELDRARKRLKFGPADDQQDHTVKNASKQG